MLDWSNTAYKFTLGLGSLGQAALMSELFRNILPAWIAVVIATFPICVFLFVRPRQLSDSIVRVLHCFGAIWYLAVAIALVSTVATRNPPPPGWQMFSIICGIGAIPCLLVIYGVAAGTYHASRSADDNSP